MTRDEQKTFVRNLTETVAESVCQFIDKGRVPIEWDGHELRELLYDKFEFERTRIMAGPGPRKSRKRVKEYQNTVLVNYLV